MKFENKISSKNIKINYLLLIFILVLIVSVSIPSLARYKNRVINIGIEEWDGTVATSYKKGNGEKSNPFIISNGSELAFFAKKLEETDYAGKYFELSNDIMLNEGIFSYENGIIEYDKEGTKYTIEPYTNTYDTQTINLFETLDKFKGSFNGNYHRIYGLYITSQTEDELALFTNLEGSVSNLYVENALIYGGNNTAGIASTAKNSVLKNILFNGYVVGNNSSKEGITSIELENIIETPTSNELTNNLEINVPNYGSKTTKVTLTGLYEVTNETAVLEINDQKIAPGEFEIELGTSYINNLELLYKTESETTYNLTNLKYNIYHIYGNAAGIVANAEEITMKNVINKADIYGSLYTAGIIANLTGLSTIERVYNTGKISGTEITSGIVGSINNTNENENVTLYQSYNVGISNISIIGELFENTGKITINSIINATDSYETGTITNSEFEIINSYTLNTEIESSSSITGEFKTSNIDELKDKTYIQTYLQYNEFISMSDVETNEGNAWIFEDNSLPILYIDDLNNPIASINVSTYEWDTLSYDLSTLKFASNISFIIKSANELKSIKESYYYISNSKTPLTKDEIELLEYEKYDEMVEISEEGYYVIYAKVLDYDDNVTYLNTDLLIVDKSGSTISIHIDDKEWTSISNEINNVYYDSAKELVITATDNLSEIKSINYYLSDKTLTEKEVSELPEESWTLYTDKVTINESNKIIYVKTIDDLNYESYANTDRIMISGYEQTSIIAGRKMSSNEDEISILNNGSITFNYKYEDTNSYESNFKHKLISSILLPQNTEITLIDNSKNKIYKYTTTNENYGYNELNKATYPLTLFQEIGKVNNKKTFNDEDYTGSINENFTIILDFKNATLENNIENAYLYMEIQDDSGNNLRPTLKDSIKKYNVYLEGKASLFLTSNYSETIIYNTDFNNIIEISSGLTNQIVNDKKIYDTSYENKDLYLAVRLVDEKENVVSKEYLKNIVFRLDEEKYFPNTDNVVYIKLQSGVSNTTRNLEIQTYQDNIKLQSGDYNFEVGVFASYDGQYNESIDYNVKIPVKVTNKITDNYNFDVLMNNDYKIIHKGEELKVTFDILQKGTFDNPNIRVSLYKKDELTAYNQNYTQVDLAEYVNNTLLKSTDKVYYASLNPKIYDGTNNTYNTFEINLVTNVLEYTGYMFEFELYDDDTKIGTIQKKFIVR